MRRHLNYANVTATLALVFAMSGGALAAHHYLIVSTKQIKPSVLKSLKGNAGKTGPAGPQGKEGAAGKEGPGGKEGPAGSAVAYAHILGLTAPGNPLDGANSKNVSSVTAPGTSPGLYCITTTVPIKNATGNTDFAHETEAPETVTINFDLIAVAIAGKTCPSSTTALVETKNSSGTDKPADFWITFN